MSGGDTISSYTGTYVQDGDKFSATVAVRRHTQGLPSVFGVDNVDITLSGKSTLTKASCFGTAHQAPGTTLQATLIRIVDHSCSCLEKRLRVRPPLSVINQRHDRQYGGGVEE